MVYVVIRGLGQIALSLVGNKIHDIRPLLGSTENEKSWYLCHPDAVYIYSQLERVTVVSLEGLRRCTSNGVDVVVHHCSQVRLLREGSTIVQGVASHLRI